MATMNDSQRKATSFDYQRELSNRREAMNLTKADLKAAIDAADDWMNLNAAAYNTALPVLARNELTAAQKAELLLFVVRRRYLERV